MVRSTTTVRFGEVSEIIQRAILQQGSQKATSPLRELAACLRSRARGTWGRARFTSAWRSMRSCKKGCMKDNDGSNWL